MAPLTFLWSLLTLALSTPAFATLVYDPSTAKQDLETIQTLKHHITVDPQGITKNWNGNNLCSYKGLFCDKGPDQKTLTLQTIDFNNYNLGGDQLTLSGFLEKFLNLLVIHVANNRFIGQVPDLSAITYLCEIDFTMNKLSGLFPNSVLKLKYLTYLDLSSNMFHGPIPKEVFEYSYMQDLFLNNNEFTGVIPEEIGSLQATYLALGANQFTGPIPRTIASAPKLQGIDLSENQLSGAIPKEIGSAKNFTYFDAGSNKLTGGIPEVVCQLKTLKMLNFTSNYLSTPLGPRCQALQARGILDVTKNCIPGAHNQRPSAQCSGQH
ncbi:hypothetical protein WAI453_007427 [Rhynchosporium graminicola]|uniref:Cell wall hydroxyproline-rich glycoprotein n=1 Tax=Rhynchosporium graminicola TaxID=2792576 RepID=A0A1E1LKM5_9HELO|nr:uncharacterized protein RCO7_10173 [Rhynchosporium commune]